MMERVERVSERLARLGLRLAVAESCTGGLLTARLTDRPGASRFLVAGLATYSDEAKTALLGVRPESIVTHGAVSEAVVTEMVDGARRAAGTEVAVAITGVAGPDGGTPTKPVGTVWIAAAVGPRCRAERHRFPGDRAEVRDRSVEAALDLLDRLLASLE
jgi:PncC family amidohydrolase